MFNLKIGQSTVIAAKKQPVESTDFKGYTIDVYKNGNKFEYDFPDFSQGGPVGGIASTIKDALTQGRKAIKEYLEEK